MMRSMIEAVRAVAKRAVGDAVVRHAGWYGLAEVAARVSRLLATIVLARMLSAADFGVAAIAITCFELVRVLTSNDIGNWIVRVEEKRLAAACNTAHRAAAVACIGAAAVQILVGLAVASMTDRSELIWMMACLSGVYLVMIPGLVPVYLVQRERRLRGLAAVGVAQVMIDNALTAVLALAGFGAWAIVLPKLLTAPIWLFGVLRLKTWRRDRAAGALPMTDLVRFCAPVLGSECLTAIRLNLDKVLVWMMLGVETLGIYYFAFNAGIGLSLVLTTALSSSLYPHLAALSGNHAEMLERFASASRRLVTPVAVILAAQSAAALLYVPLVFGRSWEHAAGLVATLCAGAISKPFYDAACQLVRAGGFPRIELMASTVLTVATLTALAAGMSGGLGCGIVAFAAMSFCLQALLAVACVRALCSTLPREGREPHAASPAFHALGAKP